MYKMIPIFKDPQRQAFFEAEGYTTFSLLTPDEVQELRAFYESKDLMKDKGVGFLISMNNPDKALCREVRDKVWSIVLPRMNEQIENYKAYVASYVVKPSIPNSVVPPHEDWSFAAREEEGYCSLSSWIALVDTNFENGGMGVIPGSHRILQNHRPSPSPQCPVPLGEHVFSLFPYMKMIDVKAGDILLFDNRTFHASPPNTSGAPRISVGIGITQKDAQLVHYYLKPDGTRRNILRYNVDEEFYLKYDNAILSRMYDEGKLIEGYGEPVEIPYEFTDDLDYMVGLIEAFGNTYNKPMAEKLEALFSKITIVPPKEEPVLKPAEPLGQPQVEVPQEYKWVDTRSFSEKYTLRNIATEIKIRLVGA